MNPLILGIESSCDDTAAAVIDETGIRSNVVAGQAVHEAWGGVVPELASRAHQENILPVVDRAIKEAGIELRDLKGIAYTAGPGLIGSLLVGASFAKAMALSLDIPLLEVHHMRAHILAHLIDDQKPSFPFLCMTVSGGHTQIVLCLSESSFELLGSSLDDAAGEAFDKSAKLIGLPYPGGPQIDQLAQAGDPNRFKFPEPEVEGLNMSFSGLKTSVMQFVQRESRRDAEFITKHQADIAASIQSTIVKILLNKLEKAVEQTGITEVGIAGGVSANTGLRRGLESLGKRRNWNTYIPSFAYCTDNAAMIARAGLALYRSECFGSQDAEPKARWPID